MLNLDLEQCQPNRQWLDRFCGNSDELLAAIEVWSWDAIGLLSRIAREEKIAGFKRLTSGEEMPIPGYFERLTDLLVAWCDLFFPSVNATPLTMFRRHVVSRIRPDGTWHLQYPWAAIAEAYEASIDVIRRIEISVAYKQYRPSQVDEKDKKPSGYLGLVACQC